MRFKDIKITVTRILARLAPALFGASKQQRVEFPWGADKLRFEHLADFDFALSARTGVLPARLHELMRRSAADLEAEVHGIRHLDQRITDILTANEAEAIPCGPAVAQIGVAVFSKDFDWRSLFAHLVELPASDNSYVRMALRKYQLYLNARLSTVRTVLELLAHAPAMASEEMDAKATVMFTADGEMHEFTRDELRRLPQGEAVTLKLAPGSAISLKLARHQFSLTHNREWALVADNGKTYTLHDGVNCVGRGRDNDVSLDSDFRNVSRKHLLAQPLANDVILLTDISSHGTYVPPTALAS